METKKTAKMVNAIGKPAYYLFLEIWLMPEKLLNVPILCDSFRPVVWNEHINCSFQLQKFLDIVLPHMIDWSDVIIIIWNTLEVTCFVKDKTQLRPKKYTHPLGYMQKIMQLLVFQISLTTSAQENYERMPTNLELHQKRTLMLSTSGLFMFVCDLGILVDLPLR